MVPIKFKEQHFIIINDIANSMFYFFDFDKRYSKINMEFEHFHSYYEICIPLCQEAIHFLKGIPYHIQCNDFVLLPPSLLHKTCYLEAKPSNRIIITFMYSDDEYGFSDAYAEILQPFYEPLPIFRFPEEQTNVLNSLINQIVDISNHCSSQEATGAQQLIIHSLFTQFLYYLNFFKKKNIYKQDSREDKTSERIYFVCNYIHTHYQEELTLESLSKEAYVSSYYLSYRLKQITGYTITEYIHLVRIRNCQYLLSRSSEKITKIALESGFASFSQFNRVFRKFCGESPSEYRKRSAMMQQGFLQENSIS